MQTPEGIHLWEENLTLQSCICYGDFKQHAISLFWQGDAAKYFQEVCLDDKITNSWLTQYAVLLLSIKITGSNFWKCQSGKMYAIKEAATCNTTRKRPSHRSDNDITDEEEESYDPKRKKSSRLSKHELPELKQETSNLWEELFLTNSHVEECKSMLKGLIEVNEFLSLPSNVVKLVCDAFKCKVCLKAPINPPIIATRYCNVLLGCSHCINTWCSGNEALILSSKQTSWKYLAASRIWHV